MVSALSFAVLVKHHPLRAHRLPALTRALEPLPTTIVTDPGADEPRRSCWRCFRACLEALPENVSHVLILEDDAIVCEDFPAGLERIAAARPNDTIALWVSSFRCLGLGIPLKRQREPDKAIWLKMELRLVPVVALLFPLEIARRFRDWSTLNPELCKPEDNWAVTNFLKAERIPLFAPLPSPIGHDTREPSVLGSGLKSAFHRDADFIGTRPITSVDYVAAADRPLKNV